MPKLFILSVVILLSLGIFSVAQAAGQTLSGYVYSDNAGWISLNCSNTNSCDSVAYNVVAGDNGLLSGYGYSQTGGWINFNPNFGGVSTNPDGTLFGWAYSEKGDWQRFDGAKVVSASDLQSEISSAKSTIDSDNLSGVGAMSLLNSLCNKFLSASECSVINN